MKIKLLIPILFLIILTFTVSALDYNGTITYPASNNSEYDEGGAYYFTYNCTPNSSMTVRNATWYIYEGSTLGYVAMQANATGTFAAGTSVVFNDTSFYLPDYVDTNPIAAYAECTFNITTTLYRANTSLIYFNYNDTTLAQVGAIIYPTVNNSNVTQGSTDEYFTWNCTPRPNWEIKNTTWYLYSGDGSTAGYVGMQTNTSTAARNTSATYNDTAWTVPDYVDTDPIYAYVGCIFNSTQYSTLDYANSSLIYYNVDYQPDITAVTITPAPPQNDTEIVTCTITATDPDGDTIGYYHKLFIDGSAHTEYGAIGTAAMTYNTSTNALNISLAEELICEGTAEDNGSSVTVANSTATNSTVNKIYNCGDGVKTLPTTSTMIGESCSICITDLVTSSNLSTGYNIYPLGIELDYSFIIANLITTLTTYDSISWWNTSTGKWEYDYLVGWSTASDLTAPEGQPLVIFSSSSSVVSADKCMDYNLGDNISVTVTNTSQAWLTQYNSSARTVSEILSNELASNVSSISWWNITSQSWLDYLPATAATNENLSISYLDSIFVTANDTLTFTANFNSTGGLTS